MGKFAIHPVLQEIAGIFIRHGKQVFLVGGAVRDLIRGRRAQDWDLATDALPEEVIALFPRVIPTGIKHGTVTVRFKGRSLEVTTYRTESGYHDGRRPDQVTYTERIEEDLSRRDFTMNAIALPLPRGPMVDPFNGVGDIKKNLIRAVGNPQERFAEDGLRPLRAVRFAAQMGFDVEEATLAAIPSALGTTEKVSPERIRDELDKILASPQPSRAFLLMEWTGLLELLLPELSRCRNIEQKGFHRFDVLDHSLLACDAAAREEAPHLVRLAALLHDIGKPLSRARDDAGIWTFYQHEQVSANLSRELLTRLRYPNGIIQTVVHLIREHMFHYESNWSEGAVRRFIIRVGEEHLEHLYRLRRADAYGTAGQVPPPDFLLPLTRRVDAVLAKNQALSLKDLAVSGKDLIALGIQPGPPMGRILTALLEAVVEDPDLNHKETLLVIAGNLQEQYS
ncbi:MAG: HD domain-containing protein [Spirochaetaceae bacterium]|jgi:putative nucleotidyltransferase with HDIG domain|nr:HD domain-containing protein [Spirochaetaceae bacterium]